MMHPLLPGHRFSDRPGRKPRIRKPFSAAFEHLLYQLHEGFWEASFAVVMYQELLEQLHNLPFRLHGWHFLYARSVWAAGERGPGKAEDTSFRVN